MVSTIMALSGSDPSAGAGLQADLRVAHSLGCFAMAVPTALTVQNSLGVKDVWPLSAMQIERQAAAVIGDIRPDAIKVGMLGNKDAAKGVLAALKHYEGRQVVVDTVLKSSSGASLFDADDDGVLQEVLCRARIITPNLLEAGVLLKGKQMSQTDAAQYLGQIYGTSVFLKGGHGEGDVLTDVFYNAETGQVLQMQQQRIQTRNTHGTGCCLSTALAVFLAKGYELNEAARCANEFLHNALQRGKAFSFGQGHGPAFFGL